MASSWSCAARAPLRSRAALECTGDLFRCWGLRREAARARPQLIRRPARRRPRDDRKPEALRCLGDAGGRESSTRRRHVPCTGCSMQNLSLVCQCLALLSLDLRLSGLRAQHLASGSSQTRTGSWSRLHASLHQRHRREKSCCTAGVKLQPWRTCRHRNNPKNVPRNRRPRRNAPTSPRSTVCKPPLAAL